METILITTGLVCIITAIVGGGLEAFNIKIPTIISSIKRQILLALFGVTILVFGIFKNSAKGSREPENNQTKVDSSKMKELTFFKDADGDGFGNKLVRITALSPPENYVIDSTDDDDANQNLYNLKTAVIFYPDLDGDGFGNPNRPKKANKQPSNYVNNNSDCDDRDRYSNPNQKEFFEGENLRGTFDYDCDGRATKQFNRVYSGVAGDHRSGWKHAIPDCGRNGIYISVQDGHATEIPRKQSCN